MAVYGYLMNRVNRRNIPVLMVAMVAMLVAMLATQSTWAQQADTPPCTQDQGTGPVTCDYDEKGLEPVGTFSAMDPEGEMIVWSLAGDDAADFDITGGVLSFKKSPNFEASADANTDNVYMVTVVATEVRAPGSLDLAQSNEIMVTVTVKNVEEDPTLTLDRLQVRAPNADGSVAGNPVSAIFSDPDNLNAAGQPVTINPTYQWYVPKVSRPELKNEDHWRAGVGTPTGNSYTPAAGEAGEYLRVVATYSDGAGTGSDKAYERSTYPVGDARSIADNNAPLFPNGTPDSFTVREDATVGTVVGTVRGSDVDSSDVLSHRLTGADDDSLFNINIATGQITVGAKLDFETATDRDSATDGTQYRVTVTLYDSLAETPPTHQVDITVTDVNDAPGDATEASPNRMVDENHPLKDDPATTGVTEEPTVLGTYTVDADTDEDVGDGISAITLSLGGVDGGLFSLTDTDALGGTEDNDAYELGFRESPNYESPADADGNNKYHVTIITADNEGATSERALVITVMNVNEIGKVTLSTTQPAVGQPITAKLTDPDMKVSEVKWQWERSELPTTGFIDIRGATSDTYTPLMTVEDDPVTSESESVDGDEGKYLRVTVTYADNASDDEDDSTVSPAKVRTRTIKKPSENAVREAPDVNQAPVFESGITREVPEDAGDGGKVGGPVTATDPDEGDELSYTISGGADMGVFEIGSTSGQITVKKGEGKKLDYEGGQTTYVVEVTARDPFGLSASTTVTIGVTDANEKPGLTAPGDPCKQDASTKDVTCDYDEKGLKPVGTFSAMDPEGEMIVWSLAGDDAADFDITGGVLSFKKSPNFEASADANTDNVYMVTVVATEVRAPGSLDLAQSNEIMVTVTVKNVEEDPTLTLDRLQVRAPNADGSVAGNPVSAIFSDPDNLNAAGQPVTINPTYQWYVPKVSRPELKNEDHWRAGVGTPTGNSYTPAAGEAGEYLRVVATYSDGAGTGSDKAYERSTYPVGDARSIADNNAPLFPNGTPDSFTVREDATVGTVVGTVRGSDVDSSDVLSHRLTGADDDSLFNINIATGQITVGAKLDFETATDRDSATDGTQYRVTVTLYDSLAETPPTHQVDITVTDVNDAPGDATEASPNRMVDENHPLKDDPATTGVTEEPTVLGTYTVDADTDEDVGDGISAITLSLGGVDGGLFSLTDTDALGGTEDNDAYELGFRESPNYESPADADGNNKYHVTIITADNEGATSERALVITVMNVNEIGKVTLSTTQPAVGQPITAKLTDPDMKVSEVKWQWERSELPTTGFIDIRGATSDTYTPLMTVEDDPVTSESESVDGDEGKYLRVTVTYADNASDDEDDSTVSPAKVRTRTIKKPSENAVREAPDVNQAPVFESGITREVPEDAGDGGKVGGPVTATDPDEGDELSYTISGGADMGVFEIGSTSGQITVKKGEGKKLDYEGGQTTYVVEVTARDPFGLSASTTVTIGVTDVNEAPDLELRPPNSAPEFPATETGARSVAENTAAGENIGAAVAATDPDAGDTLTYSLSGGADMGSFTIDGGTGQIRVGAGTDLDFEGAQTTYMVEVMADDGNGESDTVMVTITVTGVNEAPVFAEESGTLEVAENTAAGVDIGEPVAATEDPEGDTLTYTLGGDDAASFDIDAATGQLMTKAALDFETKASYSVEVTADDGNGESATVMVTIGVTDVNEAPEFPAAETGARSVAENTAAGENIGAAVAATDPDAGDTLTYSLSGDDAASFDIDAATGQLMTKAALDFETKASYSVEVTADDGNGESATVMVTIGVTGVNEAPEFPAAETGARSVAENTAAGENIGAAVAATDPDAGDTLTYTLGGDDAASFDIDAATGQLMTKAALDFETKASYSVEVTADDGNGGTDTIDVTIGVTDVNEAPEFPVAETGARSVAENTAAGENIGAAVAATDPDAGDTLTYTLGGDDAASFDIDAATGQLMTKAALDFETKASYSVEVTADDGNGGTDTIDVTIGVTITVIDVNEAPVFAEESVTLEVAENTAAGENIGAAVAATDPDAGDTLTYTLGGDDAASFDIDAATGQLMTKAALDFETKASYSVEVTADDGNGESATVMVTIGVTDVNEAPEFPAAETGARSVAENTAAGENIGAAVAATDPDAGDTLTYTLGGDDAASFDIDAATGQLMTKAALDFETKASYSVEVTADDGNGGTDTIGVTIGVTITVIDVNEAPVFAEESVTLEVAENTAAGENIGAAVAATDPDAGDTLTYTLGGDDAASFDIDAATGQLMTKAALDFETKASYSVEVTADDGNGESATVMVTIGVTDVTTGNAAGDAYDSNEDGTIDVEEALDAVDAYFDGDLDLEGTLDVIDLYFDSQTGN